MPRGSNFAGMVEAALTTPGRVSTVRWFGLGKRDGKVYVRNQRLNASQANTTSSNLTDRGWVAVRTRAMRETPAPVNVAGREATLKGCGVGVAMPQGHSWAAHPSNGSTVNVGTDPTAPTPTGVVSVGGKARRRLMPPGRGGGAVVVGGRESRPQGEGRQRDRSLDAEREGRS